MNKEDFFLYGYITKTHGYKGEVSIKTEVNNLSNFSKIKFLFIEINKKLVPFFIQKIIAQHSGLLIAKLETIDTESHANEIIKHEVYLPLKLLPKKVKQVTHLFNETIGYSVIDETQGNIGIISEILDYPHQKIISIINDKKEILIPFTDEIVTAVNRKSKTVKVACPEGLLEIYK